MDLGQIKKLAENYFEAHPDAKDCIVVNDGSVFHSNQLAGVVKDYAKTECLICTVNNEMGITYSGKGSEKLKQAIDAEVEAAELAKETDLPSNLKDAVKALDLGEPGKANELNVPASEKNSTEPNVETKKK